MVELKPIMMVAASQSHDISGQEFTSRGIWNGGCIASLWRRDLQLPYDVLDKFHYHVSTWRVSLSHVLRVCTQRHPNLAWMTHLTPKSASHNIELANLLCLAERNLGD